jgi:hypothetical protein
MKELLELVAANPDLPIVAMVNGEVCWDDTMYWMAGFSSVSVEYVGLINERWYDDADSFKEAYYDKYDEELCEKFNYNPRCCMASVERGEYTQEQLEANCLAEEELETYLSEKVREYMKKCIVVYIDEFDIEANGWKEA